MKLSLQHQKRREKKNEPEIKLILIDQSLQFPDTEEEQMNSKTITLHFIAQLIFMALRYSNTLNGFLRARNPISSKYGIWLWISRRKPDITLGNLFCEKWNNSNPPTRRRMIIWINFFSDVSSEHNCKHPRSVRSHIGILVWLGYRFMLCSR